MNQQGQLDSYLLGVRTKLFLTNKIEHQCSLLMISNHLICNKSWEKCLGSQARWNVLCFLPLHATSYGAIRLWYFIYQCFSWCLWFSSCSRSQVSILINWPNEIVGLPAAQVYINITLTITCLIFYSLASKTCPGYVTNKEVDFITLLDSIDSTQLCPDCKTIRTSRSRHCSVCGHCIERFDHHCPWLNNCIGVKNHNYFYLYVLTQECVIVFAFAQAIVSIISFINKEDIRETGTPFVP